jgi:hypothetical protein
MRSGGEGEMGQFSEAVKTSEDKIGVQHCDECGGPYLTLWATLTLYGRIWNLCSDECAGAVLLREGVKP